MTTPQPAAQAAQALIFDVDGTLAETEEAHRCAFNQAFADARLQRLWPDPKHGWVWSPELYARLLKTTGGKERIAEYLRAEIGLDPAPLRERIAEVHARKTRLFGEILAAGGLPLRDGVAQLVEQGRKGGWRLGIATTTSRPNVDAVCRAGFGCAADEVFDVIAAGDEVDRKKPAPDVYRLALKRLGLPASECLAFEDSRNGLLAAKAAGVLCLVSPSRYAKSERFDEADWLVERWDAIALDPAPRRSARSA